MVTNRRGLWGRGCRDGSCASAAPAWPTVARMDAARHRKTSPGSPSGSAHGGASDPQPGLASDLGSDPAADLGSAPAAEPVASRGVEAAVGAASRPPGSPLGGPLPGQRIRTRATRPPIDPRLLRFDPAVGWLVAAFALLAVVVAGALIAQATALAAIISRTFLDGVALEEHRGWLGLLLAAVVVRAGATWVGDVLAQHTSARVKSRLRVAVVDRLTRRAPGEGDTSTGAAVSVLTEGIDALDGTFGGYLPALVSGVIVPVAIVVWLIGVEPLSATILAVTLPLIPVFMVLIGLAARAATRRRFRSLTELSGHLLAVLQGLTTIRVARAGDRVARVVRDAGERLRVTTLEALRIAFVSALALELLAALAVATVAVTAGVRLAQGTGVAFEPVLVALLLAPEAFFPLRRVGQQFHANEDGAAAAERLFDLLEGADAAHDRGTDAVARRRRGTADRTPAPDPADVPVTLTGVTVVHAGRDGPALDGADVVVHPGEQLAILGASGAGKTTLASVLLGLREPDAGHVLVGDVEVADLDPDAWHQRLAWVPQTPADLGGTVRELVTLGRTDAQPPSDAAVHGALRAVALDGEVAALPDGLDTQVGPGGRGLSAGQRRRVAIARALVRDARLLVLDEPTGDLDVEAERAVRDALARLRGERSVVVLTHRVALAAEADRVVVLDQGRVVEDGPPDLLATAAGPYASLVAASRPLEPGDRAWDVHFGGSPTHASDQPDRSCVERPARRTSHARSGGDGDGGGPGGGRGGSGGGGGGGGGGDSGGAGGGGGAGAGGGHAAVAVAAAAVEPVTDPLADVGLGAGASAEAPRTLRASLRSAAVTLRALLAPHRRTLGVAATAGAVTPLSGVVLVAVSTYLISRAALQPNILDLTVVVVAVRALSLLKGTSRYVERLAGHDVALRTVVDLRTHAYLRLLPQAPAGLARHRSGDVLARVVTDVDRLQLALVRGVVPLFGGLIATLLTVLIAAWLLPAAAPLAAVGLGVAAVGVPLLAWRLSRAPERRLAVARGRLTAELVDVLQAAPELRLLGRLRPARAHLDVLDAEVVRHDRSAVARGGGADALVQLVLGLTAVGFVAVGVPAVVAGELDGVLLGALVVLALAAAEAVGPLPASARALATAATAAGRLRDVLDAPVPAPEPDEPTVMDATESAGDPRLDVVRATARYPAATAPAVHDLDLHVEPGRILAVVGRSGAGKSTLANLAVRFLDPEAGEVRLHDVRLSALAGDTVRGAVVLGPQDAHVFDGTIAANLRLAAPDAVDAELVDALRAARLADWVQQLPDGLATPVGERGDRLSGGQRHRLALARTLLVGAPLLVLDEPTADLDPITGRAFLVDALRAAAGRGVVILTHDLRALPVVDEVIVLNHGRIVARGRHEALLAHDPAYATSWHLQRVDPAGVAGG
jgi:ATP-binding cassette, subfamily C, bacterial CydCD